MKGYGNLSFQFEKKAQKGQEMHLAAVKETRQENIWVFVIYSYLKDRAFTAVKRDAREKGYHLLIESVRKGCLFCQKWYTYKGYKSLDRARGGACRLKLS